MLTPSGGPGWTFWQHLRTVTKTAPYPLLLLPLPFLLYKPTLVHHYIYRVL